jgi:hypothetical protein
MIHSDPILPSTSWSSEWSLSFGLPHQNFVHFSPLSLRSTCPGDKYKLWSNFFHSRVTCFLLGTVNNKIFKLDGLKFDLTIPHSMPCGKGNFVFPAFFVLFLYFQSYFHNKHHILRKLTRPRVHCRVNTLWLSICSSCWYEFYAEVLRHIFQ